MGPTNRSKYGLLLVFQPITLLALRKLFPNIDYEVRMLAYDTLYERFLEKNTDDQVHINEFRVILEIQKDNNAINELLYQKFINLLDMI